MLNAGHVLTAKTPPSSREVSQVQLAPEIAEQCENYFNRNLSH